MIDQYSILIGYFVDSGPLVVVTGYAAATVVMAVHTAAVVVHGNIGSVQWAVEAGQYTYIECLGNLEVRDVQEHHQNCT